MNMLSKEKMMEEAIKNAFKEDLGDGDHSSLACVPENDISKAKLLIKEGKLYLMLVRYHNKT